MPAPIIFIHKGLSSYLWCSLWQCHLRNPEAEIVLIGDRDPNLKYVTFEPISRHAHAASEFRRAYIHASTNGLEFERFCFERWFLLNSLVQQREWKRFVHADSDLMFYCTIESYFERLGDAVLACGRVGASSGHLMLVQDPAMLSDLCSFMLKMYLDPDLFMDFFRIYRHHRSTGADGGLCDMSALTAFIEKNFTTHYELNRVVDGTIFDQSVTNPYTRDRIELFPIGPEGKAISREDNDLFFRDREGRSVRALTIHFQGQSKSLMRRYTEAPPLRIRLEYGAAVFQERTKRALDRVNILRRHYATGIAKRLRRQLFGNRSR